MATRFEGSEAAQQFEKAFGVKAEDFTPEQLWCLTKFAKHVRLRARNNTAFNNYMNRIFPNANFKQVPKEYHGRTFEGLQITVKGVSSSDVEAEEVS